VTEKTKSEIIAAEMNKVFGPGVMKLGSDPTFSVEYLPTGVLPIDVLLGGGFPRGRFTEIYGAYSSLKSYIGLCCAALVQQAGGTAAVIDTEHSYDRDWAAEIGVNTDELIVQQPETGEDAVDLTEFMIRRQVDLVVWDSIAASLPKAEQEKMAGDKQQPARLAAMMSQAMRKLTAANSRTALVMINQTREKVGVTYGSPESIPGGKSLPFYASYRVAITKVGADREETSLWNGKEMTSGKRIVSQRYKAKLEKSKLSSPGDEVLFVWDTRRAEVDEIGFLISHGLSKGLIKKTGQTWKMTGGKTTFPNAPKFRGYIESTPAAREKLLNGLSVGRGRQGSSKDD
jgi:recombination protein RecA